MTRKSSSAPTVVTNDVKLVPKHLSKQEFARRLYKLMITKGWRQSDLARHANIPRASISTYMLAKTLPERESLRRLASALGVDPAELLPNYVESAIDADTPMLEMKVSTNLPSKAWLRINQLVPFDVATEIIALLQKHVGDNDATA